MVDVSIMKGGYQQTSLEGTQYAKSPDDHQYPNINIEPQVMNRSNKGSCRIIMVDIWDDTGKVVGKYAVVNRNLGNLGIK